MQRVFVTGGSGFIGTNLMGRLADLGIEAVNFDWNAPRDPTMARMHVAGDILDCEGLAAAMKRFQPDAVIHLAARCDLRGATLEDYRANTVGVENVIRAVRTTSSVSRVIFASSRYVHRNDVQPRRDDEYSPFTMYGASKAEGEKIVRASNLDVPWLIIRPTSIWGPWFDVPYRTFFDAVRKGVYVHPLGERLYKSFGFVGNVVHQICAMGMLPIEPFGKRTLYVADYEPVEVRWMAERIRSEFSAPAVRDVPLPVLRGVARLGDLCQKAGWKNPPLTSFRLTNLRCQMVYDMSATREVVGAVPYSMEEGIARTAAWMRRTN
jgi:nucleoside-diphosphate-sugar epimerase